MGLLGSQRVTDLDVDLVDQRQRAAEDHQPYSCQLQVGRKQQRITLDGTIIRLQTIVKGHEQDQHVNGVNNFAASVLNLLCEGIEVADIGEESSAEKHENDAAGRPFVQKSHQQSEREAINHRSQDVL